MRHITIEARQESWPLREAFTISRGSKTSAKVVHVTARCGEFSGHGEAVPYARFGETVAEALALIASVVDIRSREDLMSRMPPGAARNAVDCSLWDLDAKMTGIPAWTLAGLTSQPAPILTAYTLSLDTPEVMAAKAASVRNLPLLKLKLGGEGDAERMAAVRAARPEARLVADANEAWTEELFASLMAAAAAARIELIEQPLPDSRDGALRGWPRPVPVCADESLRTRAELPRLKGLYDAINIKLDKAGGLTEALALAREARAQGFRIMIGSMVATSLAAAPAMLLAQDAEWTDLDGPLLLARDHEHAIHIENGVMAPPSPALWG